MCILHTEAYAGFCKDVMGEFMHHVPLDRDDQVAVAQVRFLYEYTLDRMPQLFGAAVNPQLWPAAVTDAELICVHKGNQDIYGAVQAHRLFEPDRRLVA